jgi:urease accessory protein UreH
MVIYHFNQSITQSPGGTKIHKEENQKLHSRARIDAVSNSRSSLARHRILVIERSRNDHVAKYQLRSGAMLARHS